MCSSGTRSGNLRNHSATAYENVSGPRRPAPKIKALGIFDLGDFSYGCKYPGPFFFDDLSDSKLNATESPKLFATEKKSRDIIVLLLE
jgi:hypothetical protein